MRKEKSTEMIKEKTQLLTEGVLAGLIYRTSGAAPIYIFSAFRVRPCFLLLLSSWLCASTPLSRVLFSL
jgi:hypothetical protein